VQAQVREARRWVANLRTPGPEFSDISGALRQFVKMATSETAIRSQLTITGQARWCSPQTKEQLFRIAQEAITNAVRHAQPSAILTKVCFSPDSTLLRVSDDGSGFHVDDSFSLRAAGHWGLLNMKERAELVGGRLSVTSREGSGTTVEVITPSVPACGRH
jgi:signal transduction histidine kinase